MLEPWRTSLEQAVGGFELFDAHTHVGFNDPDGFTQSVEQLVSRLGNAGARGCFVFPMHEPDGYVAPNDWVLDAAASHPGVLVPFCRVDPWQDPVGEATRCLDAGARGIKLHPRAERFELDHPAMESLFALAQERGVPLLIHSGRGIPAPGRHIVALAERFPGARVILAHAAASDLSWIWRVAAELPNILFDTAWWPAADLLALFTFVPPGQILFASDMPYGNAAVMSIVHLRLALQAGLSPAQVRLIASEQSLNVASGAPLQVAGGAVGERDRPSRLLLERVGDLLQIAMGVGIRGGDPSELVDLARLACVVPEGVDDAPVFAALTALIAEYATFDPADRGRAGVLALANGVARSPDVPLPVLYQSRHES